MKNLVLALGGNALGSSPEEQKLAVKKTAVTIVDLIEAGNKLIISHGNGPQVGMINLAMDEYGKENDLTMPFAECGAMSQGYIGYHLQNAIKNELYKRDLDKSAVSILSQVLVDPDDEAFKNPSKPIGAFYTKEEAEALSKDGSVFKEDAGRGYRKVVASPKPVDIIEKSAIKTLYEEGHIVIAAGGGGIPVIKKDDKLIGVDAVIDKDFSSAKLADLVGADELVILTAVERVAINFGKEDETWLDKMSLAEAEAYLKKGEFAEGSMKPKIEAALSFVKKDKARSALITSLDKAKEALEGKTGTHIG